MLLWVCFAVLSGAVLAALLNPLLRQRESPDSQRGAAEQDIAIYRDQLAEIDAERERGQLATSEAEAARTEIARRLLAAGERQSGTKGSRDVARTGVRADTLRRLAGVLTVAVPIATTGLYLWLGSPNLPAQPLTARLTQPPDTSDVGRLIATVEARLKKFPEDGQGWDVIGPVYLRLARYPEAADAFARAIRLLGENDKRLAGLAEATVLATDGIVNDTARQAYEKLHKLQPQRPEPRFWLALAKEQDGQLQEALVDYRALLKDGEPNATWRPLVAERIVRVEVQLRTGAAPKSPGDKPPASTSPDQPRGPSADDIAAAERLSKDDQQRMIEGMVQGLAERLAKNGRDLQGWQRLIQAYSVMGRKADAVAALGRARGNFVGEPQSLTALNELARNLGLDS
ncbi:MAG: c-type cytochrome biogenesis protein CcmI [Hyphomicrobiaceae bacterium]